MSEAEAKSSCQDCVCQGVGPAFSRLAKSFGPPEAAAGHFRQARVEFLKGLRALIDMRIESLSHSAADPKGTKVTVE